MPSSLPRKVNQCWKDQLKLARFISTEVNPKRVVQMDGQSLNINFEVSDRVTQRLSTIIMKIFLTEVLGYTGVSVFEVEDEFNASDTFRRLTDGVSSNGQRM